MSPSRFKNEINVTPLADVMLVLLIIFMVVTPYLTSGVAVRLPEAQHPVDHPDDAETLVLSLKEDGTLFLNRDEIERDDLFQKVSAAMESRPEKVLYIRAGELLDYGDVLDVMDVCRRAGAEEVALITRPKKS